MSKNVLHHIGVAVGFCGLIGWFLACKSLGGFDAIVALAPAEYEGAFLMIAIGCLMAPGFFIWSRYNRWLERTLDIKGTVFDSNDSVKTENK
jgi:hypothetical protein